MTKFIYFFIYTTLFFKTAYAADSNHNFVGTHFIASYYECNHDALCNMEKLKRAMREAIKHCGAEILGCSERAFHPEGLTIIWLLSESHASIHTYPEYNACFVDLFTCGNRCSYESFDRAMQAYLDPKETSMHLLERE